MKKLATSLLSLAFATGLGFSAALAQEHAEGETPHYPIHKPAPVEWSFSGLSANMTRDNCSAA